MEENARKFVLRYVDGPEHYNLTRDGELWEETFGNLGDAFRFASRMVTESATMEVRSESGKVLVRCIVDPMEHAA